MIKSNGIPGRELKFKKIVEKSIVNKIIEC